MFMLCEDAFLVWVHVRATKMKVCDWVLFIVSQAGKRELG